MVEAASHRQLIVWQKAMDFAVCVYTVARKFPRSETYGLVSQLTRAAISVPANIAEGSARGSAKDYAQFLSIAKGSLMEAETYIMLAVRLDYVPEAEVAPLLGLTTEISKMLTAMRTKLRA